MLAVQHCEHRLDNPLGACRLCNWQPEEQDGFPCFAPELSQQSEGFEAHFFDDLFELESGNFWFRGRNRLIQWAMKKYFPTAENFLEIGCGSGYVLSGLKAALPKLDCYGSEIFVAGLKYARIRLPHTPLFQMDARQIPFEEQFNIIGAFDVLEHIAEDEQVLRQIHKATRSNGGLILTVPQHRFLWSTSDEYAHHVKRYERAELEALLRKAGFTTLYLGSFVSLLLPLMLLSRITQRAADLQSYDPRAELEISPWLNRVLEGIMTLERKLIQSGVRFPAGGSLLVVARKQPAASDSQLPRQKESP